MAKKSLTMEIYRGKLPFKLVGLALLISCGIMTADLVSAGETISGVVIDNFSEYATGSAYIVSNNFWQREGTQTDNWVVDNNCLSANRCISQNPSNETKGNFVSLSGTPNWINQSFYTYAPTTGVSMIGGAYNKGWTYMRSWQVLTSSTGLIRGRCYNYSEGEKSTTPEQTPPGNWYRVEVEWDNTSPFETFNVLVWNVEGEFIAELTPTCPAGVVAATHLGVFDLRFNAKFDNLGTAAPPELRVYGISPESGTTTTNLADDFTIGWQFWDLEWIYKDLIFYFWEANTGLVSGQQIYEPETKFGSVAYDFLDFNFEKNGKYYFKAKARSYYSVEYGALYTTDLVEPEYWIRIEIEGYEEIFEMPDFETWYAENVDRFATPTAIFTNLTSFLSPIFASIGGFIEGTLKFLDIGEAYNTGFEIGKIFPLFLQYVEQIEVFFGGFPIIQLFSAVLLILLGLFAIKFIFHFIP